MPLLDANSEELELAALLVHVDYREGSMGAAPGLPEAQEEGALPRPLFGRSISTVALPPGSGALYFLRNSRISRLTTEA